MSYVGKRVMLSANGCTKETQGKRKRKLVMYLRTRTTFILNLSLDCQSCKFISNNKSQCVPILIALYPPLFRFRFSQLRDFCCHRIIDNIESEVSFVGEIWYASLMFRGVVRMAKSEDASLIFRLRPPSRINTFLLSTTGYYKQVKSFRYCKFVSE